MRINRALFAFIIALFAFFLPVRPILADEPDLQLALQANNPLLNVPIPAHEPSVNLHLLHFGGMAQNQAESRIAGASVSAFEISGEATLFKTQKSALQLCAAFTPIAGVIGGNTILGERSEGALVTKGSACISASIRHLPKLTDQVDVQHSSLVDADARSTTVGNKFSVDLGGNWRATWSHAKEDAKIFGSSTRETSSDSFMVQAGF